METIFYSVKQSDQEGTSQATKGGNGSLSLEAGTGKLFIII